MTQEQSYPVFQHDCHGCKFLGHFFGHDVYVCDDSLLARWGNVGHEYASTVRSVFLDQLSNREHRIKGTAFEAMPFQDYLFSPHVIAYHKAWLLALAIHGFNELCK